MDFVGQALEQDHRFVKRKMKHAFGYESLATASKTIAGLECWKMIIKGQIKWGGNKSPVELFYGLAA